MSRKLTPVLLTLAIGLTIVAIGLGFLFGPSNPVPWILMLVLVAILWIYRKMAHRKELQWNDIYSVGITAMDDDHKQLIKLLNQFQIAYEYATGDEFERKALTELVEYTKHHFSREEVLMQKYAYPDIEAHKEEHRKMVAQVDAFTQDYELIGHKALGAIVDFLRDWLINHINGTDKEYGRYIQEKSGA